MCTSHQQPPVRAEAVPYYSSACRIGTHLACGESEPPAPPAVPPLVHETCGCACHTGAERWEAAV